MRWSGSAAFRGMTGVGVALVAVACAAGKTNVDDGGQGGVVWSSSSATGSGGTGGVSSDVASSSSAASSSAASSSAASSTGGGQGGAASSSVASSSVVSSSMASSSVASSSGSGGGAAGHVLLFAGGEGGLFAGRFDGSTWSTQTLVGGTNRAPALAIVDDALAVAVHRDAKTGAVTATKHDGKAWGTPTGVGVGVTTQSAPAATLRGTAVDVVFHGDDFKHYFASYAGAWSPTAEPVKPANQDQSFGPVAGAVAATGQELVLAFPGGNGALFEQSRSAGAWQGAVQHAGASTGVTPALVALSAGAELLVVFAGSDKKLMFATRTGGSWAAPAVLEANSFTGDPPALAALPNGEALVAFRGLDGKPYTSIYQPGAKPPWAAPKTVAAVNPSVVSTPSLAAGIGGKVAELAYVAADGKAYHARYENGGWTPPALIGGTGLLHAVLAAAP